MKRGSEGLNKTQKEGFLTALIKKDPTTSIRKHANELKVQEKSEWIAIEYDLSPDRKPLDYDIWSVLENKTNAASHQNINSLKTAIEKEWNEMSEKIIFMALKSFRRGIDTIIEKYWCPYSVNLLFCVNFLILLYIIFN